MLSEKLTEDDKIALEDELAALQEEVVQEITESLPSVPVASSGLEAVAAHSDPGIVKEEASEKQLERRLEIAS